MSPDAANAILEEGDHAAKALSFQEKIGEDTDISMIEVYDDLREVENQRFAALTRIHAMRLAIAQSIMSGANPFGVSTEASGIQHLGAVIAQVEDTIRDLGKRTRVLVAEMERLAIKRTENARIADRIRSAQLVLAAYRFEG